MRATAEDIRARLRINKHALDDELEIHAQLHDELCQHVAEHAQRVADLKEALARVEASVLLDLRGAEKLTASELSARVTRDTGRQIAVTNLAEARAEHAMWEGLLRAWEYKGSALKTLAQLHVSGYFAQHSASTINHDQRANMRAASTGRRTLLRD